MPTETLTPRPSPQAIAPNGGYPIQSWRATKCPPRHATRSRISAVALRLCSRAQCNHQQAAWQRHTPGASHANNKAKRHAVTPHIEKQPNDENNKRWSSSPTRRNRHQGEGCVEVCRHPAISQVGSDVAAESRQQRK
ncbi:unnamed protein product [Trichogramma brassicae]|uniref:Uncharacterized protein n=1 Tax=Trichogramma brassicae TaxID=86971 RepID=A0A6H5IMH4_9HYME|nr:unnamed protein product [Trichogramma brassicae]